MLYCQRNTTFICQAFYRLSSLLHRTVTRATTTIRTTARTTSSTKTTTTIPIAAPITVRTTKGSSKWNVCWKGQNSFYRYRSREMEAMTQAFDAFFGVNSYASIRKGSELMQLVTTGLSSLCFCLFATIPCLNEL